MDQPIIWQAIQYAGGIWRVIDRINSPTYELLKDPYLKTVADFDEVKEYQKIRDRYTE